MYPSQCVLIPILAEFHPPCYSTILFRIVIRSRWREILHFNQYSKVCNGAILTEYVLDQPLSINFLLKQTWLRFGVAALTSLAILSIISLRSIRTKAYEFFFYAHFVLVL